MLTLKTIWMFYRICWTTAWCDEDTPEREAYESLLDVTSRFTRRCIDDSPISALWLLFFICIFPVASLYFIGKLFIRDLKKEVFS